MFVFVLCFQFRRPLRAAAPQTPHLILGASRPPENLVLLSGSLEGVISEVRIATKWP